MSEAVMATYLDGLGGCWNTGQERAGHLSAG